MSTFPTRAVLAVVALFGLSAASPAVAVTKKERLRQVQTEAVEEWKAARRLHREGRIQAAFVRLERLESALDADEALSLELIPEVLSDKKRRRYVGGLAYGTLHARRRFMADIYLAHGCYRRAAAVADRQLALVRQAPDFEVSPVYRQLLVQIRDAAVGLGQVNEAIALQDEILAHDKRLQSYGGRSKVPGYMKAHYAAELVTLALFHQEVGNRGRAAALLAEARATAEHAWRDERRSEWLSDRDRLRMEARFLEVEGRYGKAKATLENVIASELEQAEAPAWWFAGTHIELANLHARMDQTSEEKSVLETSLRHLVAADPINFSSVAETAHRLAMALRKAGRMDEANALREKYRLCFD